MTHVNVNKDDVLCFDPENERLDLPRPQLRKIVGSMARLAHVSYEYVQGLEVEEGRKPRREKWNTMRKLATIRDSGLEMVKLLAGEDLDEPGVREDLAMTFGEIPPWDAIVNVTDTDQSAVNTAAAEVDIDHGDEMIVNPPSKYAEMPSEVVAAMQPRLKTVIEVEEEYALREAEIFKRIKDVQCGSFVNEDVKRELQAILDYIKERQDG